MRKALRTINMIIQYHFCEKYPKINLEVIFKLVTSIPEEYSPQGHETDKVKL